ncbi:putative LRR receptor-like serine/threonine-protein kinase At1g14390 [Wolffia australiana]
MAALRRRSPPVLQLFVFLALVPSSLIAQQLPQSQIKTIFRLQRLLEFPAALSSLNEQSHPCYLPKSDSLSIVCNGSQVTELSIAGDRDRPPLSSQFNMDSFVTTLAGLPDLTVLSLVSLGLWGSIPPKIDRFRFLRVLNLSSNSLSGPLPREISTMPALQTIVLSDNNLNGSFPLLPDSVVTVSLRNNSLRSSLPLQLKFLVKLEALDVAGNQITGVIPPLVFSLPAIRTVDLSGNLLSGSLPGKIVCGARLRFVDISRNRLSGTLPSCIQSNSALEIRYSGNCLLSGSPKLQHPASYCSDPAIAAVMPKQAIEKQPNNRLGFVLGVIGGVVGAALVLGVALIFILRKSNSHAPKPPPSEKTTASDTRHLLQSARLATVGVGSYRVFSAEEIEEATCNFSSGNLIPESKTQFETYNGRLEDGSNVVIKRLKLKQKHSSQSLGQFIDAVAKLRHRYVVSVLGHCVADEAVYLVFEAISNGNLRTHMTEWRKREMLKWPQRAAAAIGLANGVKFLHSIGVSGNDLSIENILLDETLAAKISNYNLPTVTKNKNAKGGVESPFEGVEDGDFVGNGAGDQGEKRDVYQLGLILLEIILGSPVSNPIRVSATTNLVRDCLSDGPAKLAHIVDPCIQGTFAHDSLRAAADLALSCAAPDASQRPSIDDVIWNLQYAVQLQEAWATASRSGPIP